ncbi:MAG TPA: HPr kinase/phosphatase C-terminal domain-containing protein [Rhizomicrobium sp.]|nr:HPr kinase/phosphatase C-terminal domain-containing protein [Rhizomicrobium sp.]
MVNIHASCVLLGDAGKAFGAPEDAGVLLLGESGKGKSDLALRLIERGATLVADDRTELLVRDGALFARAPKSLAGLMEVRGLGIVALPFAAEARVRLAVEMMEEGYVPRMPDPERYAAPPELDVHEDERPPLIWLAPFEASTPAKIALAAAAFSKALFREHRNP